MKNNESPSWILLITVIIATLGAAQIGYQTGNEKGFEQGHSEGFTEGIQYQKHVQIEDQYQLQYSKCTAVNGSMWTVYAYSKYGLERSGICSENIWN